MFFLRKSFLYVILLLFKDTLWCHIEGNGGSGVGNLDTNSSIDTLYRAMGKEVPFQAKLPSSVKRSQILVLEGSFFFFFKEMRYCTYKFIWRNEILYLQIQYKYLEQCHVHSKIIKFPPVFWNNLQSGEIKVICDSAWFWKMWPPPLYFWGNAFFKNNSEVMFLFLSIYKFRKKVDFNPFFHTWC